MKSQLNPEIDSDYITLTVCKTRITNIFVIDVDECAADTHNCDHICINSHGSYYCKCIKGYRLNVTDARTCDGKI